MECEYFYCNSCGYEDFDVRVGYSRATASTVWCFCPECQAETSCFVEIDNGEY